jgi:hypothetical protein
MGENTEKVKDLQYSWSSFLWKNITLINENWDLGDLPKALGEAVNLVVYLPVKVKEELEPYAKEITAKMNKAYETESSDFHSTMLSKSKASMIVARQYLGPFLKLLMGKLDERGYLERGSYTPITKEDFKKLEGEGEQSED